MHHSLRSPAFIALARHHDALTHIWTDIGGKPRVLKPDDRSVKHIKYL